MTIKGPYTFRLYSQSDADIEQIRSLGLEPTRVVFNDGSVPISGTDEDGERVTIATVRPIAPRKRNTPYDAPDDERDALAQRIVDALNAAEPS
jgi:hypothetical protein